MNSKLTKHNKKLNQKKKWTTVQIFSFLFILGYLSVELIKKDITFIDNMHPQWLYLSIINLVAFLYIGFNLETFASSLNSLKRNPILLAFILFITLSAVSILQAINVFQGFETLGRNITVFCVFVVNTLFLFQVKDKIHIIAKIIALYLVYQSIDILVQFWGNKTIENLDDIILSVVAGYGNKNITSVGLLIKVPFLIFLIDHYRKGFWHYAGLLLFAISVFDILLLNARASFVGFAAIILISFCLSIFYYFKAEREKAPLVTFGKISGVVILVIVFNSLLFSSLEKSKNTKPGVYGSAVERVSSISMSGSSGRDVVWGWTIDLFRENWILGCGTGNYPIAVMKIENNTRNSFNIFKHAHNDFLETGCETGIFGLISYTLIYLLSLSLIGRGILRTDDTYKKRVLTIAFMCLAIYFVDAFFNFPHERPPIHLYFGLIPAIVVASLMKPNKEFSSDAGIKAQIVLVPLIVLSVGIIYVNTLIFKSSMAQKLVHSITSVKKESLKAEFRNMKADDLIRRFPKYPNVNYIEMPIATIKADLLFKEGRYDEALAILTSSKKANPYYYGDDKIRYDIFKEKKLYDSAYYYANVALKAMPDFYESHLNIGIIEYDRGNFDLARRHFERAIQLNNRDYVSYENLGVILYNSKEYPKAIEYLSKVIDSNTTTSGKAELIRGWCYFFSGDKEKACADYQRSVNKKNALAVQYLEGCK